MERSTTIPVSGLGLENTYPNQQEYGAIANGVGENPLNGNGVLSFIKEMKI